MSDGFIIIGITLLFICLFCFLFWFVFINKKNKRIDWHASKPKRRFRYLDTFYYYYLQASTDGSYKNFIAFHVIYDIDSKLYYAIEAKDTNSHIEKKFDKISILKGDGYRSKWKKVSFNDDGIFWIDQELNGYYKHIGDEITIDYLHGFGKEHKINVKNELFHLNSEYNESILDKVTFITGYAEFNVNNE